MLASEEEQQARELMLSAPHMAPLRDLVEEIRSKTRKADKVPNFDPCDGGIGAGCLFVLEAPGPKTVTTGFVSRDNPDLTAANFCLLNDQARIDRRLTAIWNIVPWYLGDGVKIRAAQRRDVEEGTAWLWRVIEAMPNLRVVAFVGKAAGRAKLDLPAGVARVCMPHPSPVHINRNRKTNWEAILRVLREEVAPNLK